MSRLEPGSNREGGAGRAPRPAGDARRLRAWRRDAGRTRRLARVDLGIGLLGALILLVATPGLAITGLIALIVLLLCTLTFLLERRRR
ncbi:MAG TPA: hypothetical protein VNY34_04020 [Solirubrobacteraceae bacterium]|jgi:hypothetical protein|nr:hypothetical protein [Solirubrobacteraceae bacterium]